MTTSKSDYLRLLTRRELHLKIELLENSKSWRYTSVFRYCAKIIRSLEKKFKTYTYGRNRVDLRNSLVLYSPVTLEYGSLTGIQRVVKNICIEAHKKGMKYFFVSIEPKYFTITKINFGWLNHDSKTSRYKRDMKNIFITLFFKKRKKYLIKNCLIDHTTNLIYTDLGIGKNFSTDLFVLTHQFKTKNATTSVLVYDLLGIKNQIEQVTSELIFTENFDWIHVISEQTRIQYLNFLSQNGIGIDHQKINTINLGSSLIKC